MLLAVSPPSHLFLLLRLATCVYDSVRGLLRRRKWLMQRCVNLQAPEHQHWVQKSEFLATMCTDVGGGYYRNQPET